jgi:hypothetical protein
MNARSFIKSAAGRRAVGLMAALPLAAGVAALVQPPAAEASATFVTDAYYMSASTASGLDTQAYNDGYAFAQQVTGGQTAFLILDFGEVTDNDGDFGACDFSGGACDFDNAQILTALENASDGVHAGYTSGTIIITYGNSNYDGTGLDYAQYKLAGEYQEQRANDLSNYEVSEGRVDQGAAAGADMEPDYNTYANTKGLVDGTSASGDGYAYIDYGSADGCPTSGSSGSCDNGWTVGDEAYVSYTGNGDSFVMPEIYSVAATAMADQWTVIRKNAGAGYSFLGVSVDSAADGGSLWSDLNSLNSGLVGSQIVVF